MKNINPIDPVAFGNRVRELRKECSWSQVELGKHSGYSQTHIGWIENGGAQDPEKQAIKLVRALGTTQQWLFYGTGRRELGPRMLSGKQIGKLYDQMPPEERHRISQEFLEFLKVMEAKKSA